MRNAQANFGRLIAVFFLGVLLLTCPLLSLFDQPVLMFGIPLLFLYLFAVWVVLIVLIFFVTKTPSKKRPSPFGLGKPPEVSKDR